MSSLDGLVNERDCVFETPLASQSRKRIHGSVTNFGSHKRRRVSTASVDLGTELDLNNTAGPSAPAPTSADRFISSRPKLFLPLEITPRTRRISKQFGLIDDRVLNFKDDTDIFTTTLQEDSNPNTSTVSLIRRSASSLFNTLPTLRPTSVTENLNKRRHCLMVLDSPGVSLDPDAFAISWSLRNLIAVACKDDVYYQNLETRSVSQLCSASSLPGKLGVIQWGDEKHDNYLALGMSKGTVQMWDAGAGGKGTAIHTWNPRKDGGARSLAWNHDLLTIGMGNGDIVLTDIRSARNTEVIEKHKAHVLGLQWSADHNYLASSDKSGAIHIWDRRVGKSLLDFGQPITKMRHKAPVKALAWCPWKPDLLATGSTAPEGKIKIWSTSLMSPQLPEPTHTIPLNTTVLSLHWSPHCKELLSTHGPSFMPLLSTRHRSLPSSSNTATTSRPGTPTNDTRTNNPNPTNPDINNNNNNNTTKLTYTKTPLTNSITVHEYPSCKRLMTLTNAHNSHITHSCLSPNGESIFTVCPREEAIKMWQVWSTRRPPPKRESAFDKFVIR
ncbi:WD40 repeat-like protein [Agrocybe pediades]|nr:WD40 repeat-like protein [Agrocybe pediades]